MAVGAGEKGLTRNQVIAELTRSPHGDLKAYLVVGKAAAKQQPDFMAHLIAWNARKGQVRDAKVALPVVSLAGFPQTDMSGELRQNSLAHLAMLDPRNLVRAALFARDIQAPGQSLQIRKMVTMYLRAREQNWSWWERSALAHRKSMKSLYALGHVKPTAMADLILFKEQPPVGTIFWRLRQLATMPAAEAAGTITEWKLPFLTAMGALGARAKEPDLLMALIRRMSPTELVTNAAALERLGVKTDPALRAAFEEGLARVADSDKATLKTTQAAKAVASEGTRAKLHAVQERQIDKMGRVTGNWLVLGDCSGSMTLAIETAKHVAAILAKAVEGQVHLVFFNTHPTYYDATGKTFEQISEMTRGVRAGGGTSIGCGVAYAILTGRDTDGIAIVSDGQENAAPYFVNQYPRLASLDGKDIPVYLYRVGGQDGSSIDLAKSMHQAGLDLQEFDLRGGVDYYSLPNLVQTMRANKYSLGDEIMETPLVRLADALKPGAMLRA